jgi:hypothetical protein
MGPSRLIRQSAIVPPRRKPADDDPSFPISEFLRTGPLSSPLKIVVIEDAERLIVAATNAFLQMLEEPPEYARYVLMTENLGALAPTIVSRCLVYACPATDEDLTEDVSEGEAESALVARRVAQLLVTGGPMGCLRLAEELREACDQISEDESVTKRSAHARVIANLAAALAHHGASPVSVQEAIEAHRRVQGNASASLTFDAFLASIALRESQIRVGQTTPGRAR